MHGRLDASPTVRETLPPVLDVLLEVIAPVLLVATVGGVVGRWLGLSVDTLSNVVFYLFSPALVFTAIAYAQVAADDVGRILVVALGVFLVNVACASAWGWSRGTDPETRAVAVISSAAPNQGNMGLPMAQLAFGARGLQVAVVIWVIGTVVWSSLGIAAGMVAKGGHTRLSALATPFRFPTIYAALLGLVVNVGEISLPVAIGDSVDTLADAAIPCMLVVLGLSFRLPEAHHLAEPVAASVNRLVIGPLAAWPLTALVGLEGVTASTAILLAGMPAAVMTTILALQLGLRTELAVRVVIVSTALSILSLTVLITLLR